MSLGKSFLTISGLTLTSRILGFVRDVLLAALLGAGSLADVFYVAFKFPNLFRGIFAEGAFNAAFIPMFSSRLEKDKKTAKDFAEQTFMTMAVLLFFFVLIAEFFMEEIMSAFAPGFKSNPEQFALVVELSSIAFLYLFFVSVLATFTGILNSMGRFSYGAGAPILFNMTIISALFIISPHTETLAHGLVWGMVIAGILQTIWLFTALKKHGMPLKLRVPTFTPEIRRMFMIMLPAVIAAGTVQINVWADTVIATLFPKAVSYLYYGVRIGQLPQGVIAVAVGTALLPVLSALFKSGRIEEGKEKQNRAIKLSLLFTFPAAVGLVMLSWEIVMVLFERGAFTAEDSHATSLSVLGYALALPSISLGIVLRQSFFAEGDTTTPVRVALFSIVVNVILNFGLAYLFFMNGYYPHFGIVLATAVSSWVSTFALFFFTVKRDRFKMDLKLFISLGKIMFCSCVMGLALYLIKPHFHSLIMGSEVERVFALSMLIGLGLAVFVVGVLVTKTVSISEIKNNLKRQKA
jgi:putative peptidoglycan lipid II flippase